MSFCISLFHDAMTETLLDLQLSLYISLLDDVLILSLFHSVCVCQSLYVSALCVKLLLSNKIKTK